MQKVIWSQKTINGAVRFDEVLPKSKDDMLWNLKIKNRLEENITVKNDKPFTYKLPIRTNDVYFLQLIINKF
jgi:hypothetical protein